MKLSLALMFLLAVLLSGCSRPVVKETVVERPVVVERPAPAGAPVVIERPAAAGATTASCVYASQGYSHGALSCQDKTEFKCENGVWRRTFTAC
jgi:hypothetical protein